LKNDHDKALESLRAEIKALQDEKASTLKTVEEQSTSLQRGIELRQSIQDRLTEKVTLLFEITNNRKHRLQSWKMRRKNSKKLPLRLLKA